MLSKIITKVEAKIVLELFIAMLLKKFIKYDFFSSLISVLSLDKKFKIVGNNKNVTMNDVIKPNVIIHPKSMIGFISLKIKDKNAHIVVSAVYKIGQNIFDIAKNCPKMNSPPPHLLPHCQGAF